MAKKQTQDEVNINDDQIKTLEERIQSLEDQLKRAVADYYNLEKRVTEGRSELSSWATVELIKKLLPVLDNLEKAVSGMNEDERKSGWAQGVVMSVKQFNDILASEGLDQISADGEFDPNLHEAVDSRDGENDKILEVLNKGYKIGNKVLRPTQVVVGKAVN
jgi:molecular chaperone GrpE